MSPTAQPDVRPSFESALPGETAGPDKNSSSSGTAGISSSKPKSASENRGKEPRETIVIISISCFDWRSKHDNKSMRLTSVRHDLNLQLDRHNYLHQGTKTDFLIYTDYKHEYADSAGTRAPVPRREATQKEILDGLAKAVSNGGSVVIYYSGHCCRRGAGKSTLTLNDGYWIYEEDGESRAGPPYLISSDGQRIYGKDVYAALEKGMGIGRNITITLIFDTCHAATFFDKVVTFPWVYQAGAIECSTERQRKEQGSQIQIIFLTATKFEEEAHTFKDKADPKRENGAVTKVMTRFYDKARANPKAPRSAEALAEKLYDACHERQTPQIRALSRIRGDFLITH